MFHIELQSDINGREIHFRMYIGIQVCQHNVNILIMPMYTFITYRYK